MPIIADVIIGKIITAVHYLDRPRTFFVPTFAKKIQSGDETQMRGLRGREVISGRKPAKNWRKLVSIRGTVSLINSVRRGASRITATAAKAVGLRSPAKSGLNLIYTTHFLAPGGSAYLRGEAHEGAVCTERRRDGEFPRVSTFHRSPGRTAATWKKSDDDAYDPLAGTRLRRSRLPAAVWFPLGRITRERRVDGRPKGRRRRLINCSAEEGRCRMTCCGSLKVDGR